MEKVGFASRLSWKLGLSPTSLDCLLQLRSQSNGGFLGGHRYALSYFPCNIRPFLQAKRCNPRGNNPPAGTWILNLQVTNCGSDPLWKFMLSQGYVYHPDLVMVGCKLSSMSHTGVKLHWCRTLP